MQRDPSLIPLSHQHQHGLALCVRLERGLAAAVSRETVLEFARQILAHFDEELDIHFQVEEQTLFPAVPGPMVDSLIAGHRRIREMVETARSAPDAGLLRDFAALLRSHIRKEENELFEEIQRRLPRRELDRLGAAIDTRLRITYENQRRSNSA